MFRKDSDGNQYYNVIVSPWRWVLSKITTPFSRANGTPSVTIHYTKVLSELTSSTFCGTGAFRSESDIYPREMIYPNQYYRVLFNVEPVITRYDWDEEWNYANSDTSRFMFSQRRLDTLQIDWNNGTPAAPVWQKFREYVFTCAQELGGPSTANPYIYPNYLWSNANANSGVSPNYLSVHEGANTTDLKRHLTLRQFQELNYLPGSAAPDVSQPALDFKYGDGMHLTEVNNNQGGKVSYTYTAWSPKLSTWATAW